MYISLMVDYECIWNDTFYVKPSIVYGFTGYGMRKTVAQRFRDGQLVHSGMHLALSVELFLQKSITVHRYNPP